MSAVYRVSVGFRQGIADILAEDGDAAVRIALKSYPRAQLLGTYEELVGEEHPMEKQFRADVEVYVKELDRCVYPVQVSTSHFTLSRLYKAYGMEAVDAALDEIFAADRKIHEEASRREVDEWYQKQASAYERFQEGK